MTAATSGPATGPANGTVTVGTDGSFSLPPNANYNGPDSFTYTITDADGDISTATATINVAPVNDVPVAADDTCPPWKTRCSRARWRATTPRRVTVNVWAVATGRPTARSRWAPTAASHPERQLQRSGQFHLHHHRHGDIHATATMATMRRWPPTTPGRGRHAAHGQPRDQRHPVGDGGNVWARGRTARSRWKTAATFVHTPNANYSGPDSFTYTITDADGDISTATATINVAPTSDAPIALDDTTAEDTPVIIDVLGNDSDPDGDTLTITEVAGQPIGLGSPVTIPEGTVALNPGRHAQLHAERRLQWPGEFRLHGERRHHAGLGHGRYHG